MLGNKQNVNDEEKSIVMNKYIKEVKSLKRKIKYMRAGGRELPSIHTDLGSIFSTTQKIDKLLVKSESNQKL